jgi:hypothetical protein
VDASLNKSVQLTNDVKFTLHITATNILNHPVWALGPAVTGVGINFPQQEANINSTTFGQSLQPQNNGNARQLYVRAEISF